MLCMPGWNMFLIKMKKGQLSMEFMFVVGMLFIILIFLIGLSFNNRISLMKNERFVNLRSECLKLSTLIFGVYINGKGTMVQERLDYKATLFPNSRLIDVEVTDADVTCTIPINAMSNVALDKGDILIVNVGDFVEVKNV